MWQYHFSRYKMQLIKISIFIDNLVQSHKFSLPQKSENN